MTTEAKNTKPKTADELAKEQETAAMLSAAEAADKAAGAQGKLVEMFESGLKKRDSLEAQLAAMNERLSALAAQVNRPEAAPALLEIQNTSFDPVKAAERLADIWPKDDALRPIPKAVTAYDYEVVPTGKKGTNRPKAIVRCCSDEGDAKAAYNRATGSEWPVRVNLVGEYKPAGTDSAAANAA